LDHEVKGLETDDPRRLSWLNVDVFSRVWVSAWPGTDAGMANDEFAEMVCVYLGLDSPACNGLVGKPIGSTGRRLDAAGFRLTSVTLPGDGWRQQHDAVKWTVAEMAREANVPVDVEVYGLFEQHIAGVAEFRADTPFRSRQGMIPDLMIELDNRRKLYDVKTYHVGASTYTARNPRSRPVDRRAERVGKECLKDAHNIDVKYNGVSEDVRGPVEAKLRSYGNVEGLVVGAFGELSRTVDHLVGSLADVAAVRYNREIGMRNVQQAGGMLRWSYRLRLGMVAWKQAMRLRLDRIRFVGVRGEAAVERRQQAELRRRVARVQGVWDDWRQGRVLGGRRGLTSR